VAAVRFGDFEWDRAKADSNQQKHGVSFEEASEVFDDPRAVDAPDLFAPGRFVVIGRSARDRVLLVVHALHGPHGRIRIIAARKASAGQRKAYEDPR
jgi:uncharacterized DUF497 family protein